MTTATDVPKVKGSAAPPPRRRRQWGWLLVIPGLLYLVVFFLLPTIQLIGTSLYDPNGSFEYGYDMTWHFQNYWSPSPTTRTSSCGRSAMRPS